MTSEKSYVEVDLVSSEKKQILKLAGFCVHDAETLGNLANSRKKWVAFLPEELDGVIGELSYHCNRTQSLAKAEWLDGLASHLELALSAHKRAHEPS